VRSAAETNETGYGTPAAPLGGNRWHLMAIQRRGEIERREIFLGGTLLSVTSTVKLNVPVLVGVPLIFPARSLTGPPENQLGTVGPAGIRWGASGSRNR